MSKEFILKKNIFGGFDRRQVIDYLAQLQEKCADSSKSEIEKVNLQIKAYLEKIEEKNRKIESLKSELDSLNKLSDTPVSNVFQSLEKADEIVSSAKKEVERHIRYASENISENNEKFTQLISRVDSLKAELAKIGSRADDISSKISTIDADEPSIVIENRIEKSKLQETVETAVKTDESDEEPNYDYSETYILSEDFDIADTDDISEENHNISNSIDNFFAELEKLTGSADFYDNGPDIDEAFDKPKKNLPIDSNK